MAAPLCNSLTKQSGIDVKSLDPTKRPPALQSIVNSAFQSRVGFTRSSWDAFNGYKFYGMCLVDEQKLLKEMILKAYPNRKNFNVIEIGAGEFQWGKAMADFIEKDPDLPKDITVKILNLRAESNPDNLYIKTDRCEIYNYGAFKSEDLLKELSKNGHHLEDEVDLVVSRWCFRHLADPVGTFVQTVQLLRPGSGVFLGDGFIFLYENEKLGEADHNEHLTRLMLDSKSPFLMLKHDECRSLNQFVLKRLNQIPACALPMSYDRTETDVQNHQIGSECVTTFKRSPQATDNLKILSPTNYRTLYGDKELFNELQSMKVLTVPNLDWRPILRKENLHDDDLRKAAISGDLERARECLFYDISPYQKDELGCTPFHLSIKNGHPEVSELFLSTPSILTFTDIDGKSPLHYAAMFDMEGTIVNKIAQKKVRLNAKDHSMKTAVDLAIEAKNLKAIVALFESSANFTRKNWESLKDDSFACIHETLGIINEESETHSLKQVMNLIKEGNLVVLYQYGGDAIMYNSESKQPTQKLIYIHINPQSGPLLNEDEWLFYIRQAGHSHVPFDKEKIKQKQFTEVLKYNG